MKTRPSVWRYMITVIILATFVHFVGHLPFYNNNLHRRNIITQEENHIPTFRSRKPNIYHIIWDWNESSVSSHMSTFDGMGRKGNARGFSGAQVVKTEDHLKKLTTVHTRPNIHTKPATASTGLPSNITDTPTVPSACPMLHKPMPAVEAQIFQQFHEKGHVFSAHYDYRDHAIKVSTRVCLNVKSSF